MKKEYILKILEKFPQGTECLCCVANSGGICRNPTWTKGFVMGYAEVWSQPFVAFLSRSGNVYYVEYETTLKRFSYE